MSDQHRSRIKDPEPEHFICIEGLPVVVLEINDSRVVTHHKLPGFKNVDMRDKPFLLEAHRLFSKQQMEQLFGAIRIITPPSERPTDIVHDNNIYYQQDLSKAIRELVSQWGIEYSDSIDTIVVSGYYNSAALLSYYDECEQNTLKRSRVVEESKAKKGGGIKNKK